MGSLNIDQGHDILDILPRLIDNIGDISTIKLFVLNADTQSDRVVDRPELKEVAAEALRIRKEHQVPFWEAVLLVARREEGVALELVLDAAIHHQPMSAALEEIQMTTEELSTQEHRRIAAAAGGHSIVVLSSKIRTKSSESPAHLQMLDFRVRPNEENERLAVEILKRVGVEGILLNSGNSYHFYGYRLMTSDAELASFLGRVSLFAPFVDQRWIAHQMIEGACALRVSKGKSFGRPPEFVRNVGKN